ncbi:serine hydrolase domain-containing protein [Nocardioides jensenii]|uniref:serine hydrolase domain-containing protein n=1 Tax=Nocardioides jensenii TaxID=1843 RepID=UPI00082C4141|nr:serine hydrolase domain-containing protein [Nocardioides jensenii]
MARRILAALTTVVVLGVAHSPAAHAANHHRLPPPDDSALSASITGLPDEAVTSAQLRVTGRDGRWSGRAGVRDVRTGRAVPPSAGFRIGSATKVFTAAIVVQLVAEGRLRLSDPVQRWLPGVLPASYPTVTVRQLLDHTSGLPMSSEDAGHEDPAWVVRHRFDWHTPRAVVRSATRHPMSSRPGTQQQYNGVNYFLAGMIIERVTGHAYAHELRARLLEPLHLKGSYLPERGEVRLRGRHTHGYVRVDGALVDVTAQSAYAWAEGGMVSTTRDLARFLRRLLAGEVVSQRWLDEMLEVPDLPYAGGGPARFGIGLERTELPGGVVVWGKSGSVPGFRTLAVATEDRGRAVALSLTTTGNGDGSEGPRLMRMALAAFRTAG